MVWFCSTAARNRYNLLTNGADFVRYWVCLMLSLFAVRTSSCFQTSEHPPKLQICSVWCFAYCQSHLSPPFRENNQTIRCFSGQDYEWWCNLSMILASYMTIKYSDRKMAWWDQLRMMSLNADRLQKKQNKKGVNVNTMSDWMNAVKWKRFILIIWILRT